MYRRDWASVESGAAFAAFAHPDQRAGVARLLVRLQGIYQYADVLMEQPSINPSANARQLHTALLVALQAGRAHADYYTHNAQEDDGGFLVELVDVCRTLLTKLPAYALVEKAALDQAHRIVFYQTHVNLAAERDLPALERWAEPQHPAGAELRWWELAAASGSSVAAYALLSAAADPDLTTEHAKAIEALYCPWMGALHTLLDNLIDHSEDTAMGQHNLLDHYSSPEEMAERMEWLAVEAVHRAGAVGVEHSLILAGMASLYLSDPNARQPYALETTERVLAALGGLAKPAMLVLRARRLAHRDGPRAGPRRSLTNVPGRYPISDIR